MSRRIAPPLPLCFLPYHPRWFILTHDNKKNRKNDKKSLLGRLNMRKTDLYVKIKKNIRYKESFKATVAESDYQMEYTPFLEFLKVKVTGSTIRPDTLQMFPR
jgi:hypothetical protein